jgi:hypothetical protein
MIVEWGEGAIAETLTYSIFHCLILRGRTQEWIAEPYNLYRFGGFLKKLFTK